jgi:DNA-binding CsgD family transcriptional regulator
VSARAERYFETGRWDEALTEAAPAARPDSGVGRAWAHGLIALIAGHSDDRALAGQHLTAADGQEAHPVSPDVPAYLVLARAVAAERAGQPGTAAGLLAETLNGAAGDVPHRYVLLPALARLALAAGDAETAAAAARTAAADADREALPARAAAMWCQGLLNADPDLVLDAAASYESAGRPLARAQALEDAAELLTGTGQVAVARQALADAADLYRQLGTVWDMRRAEARLRRSGIREGRGRPRPRPDRGWGSLTPAEARIARLVADGRSNPEIAAELSLSRNTVQTHVSHILAKLGARSRGEIIRQALGHPPMTHLDSRRLAQ